jgi:hypothetical protein
MVTPLDILGKGRFRWTVLAFIFAWLLVSGLVVWQLYETTPARWCAVALQGSPEVTTGCYSVLLKLLDIKDHAVLYLMIILGITTMSLTVIALGVGIKASAPGGTSVDIGAENTQITTPDASVTVPTPPTENQA